MLTLQKRGKEKKREEKRGKERKRAERRRKGRVNRNRSNSWHYSPTSARLGSLFLPQSGFLPFTRLRFPFRFAIITQRRRRVIPEKG